MNEFEGFLSDIVEFINEVRGQARQERYQLYANEIFKYYISYGGKAVLEHLKNALNDDLELYSLVLFTLYTITESPDCIYYLYDLVQKNDIDIFACLDIYMNIQIIKFQNYKVKISYEMHRKIHKHLLERIQNELDMSMKFLPYKERNRKRILLATDTLLSEYHAPSRIVYLIIRTLCNLGYEVAIVVNVQMYDFQRRMQYCLTPYWKNYNRKYNFQSVLEYEGKKIPIHQMLFSEQTINEQKKLFDYVYQWKPMFVWMIGASEPIQDLYRNIVTQISMGCTDGYPFSESPVLASYMQSGSEYVKESVEYAKRQKQKLLNFDLDIKYQRENWKMTRKDLGIPERKFVLCIVGNRLDTEISIEFKEMLNDLLEIDHRFYIVLIGKCKNNLLKEFDSKRYKLLGYRKDINDVIAMTDLFINPPRQGGGGGAARALAVEVPVVTLPDCDVYNVVGNDFCYSDLHQMKQIIMRYLLDSDFYGDQQEKAKRIIQQRNYNADNFEKEIKKVVDQVEEWLEKGEIQ